MSKSHVAGRPSEEPTPAQLKELFAQIESGRVTKGRLQAFLRGATEEATISQRMAHAILGTNFFGAGEWALAYDVDFTKKQFREVAEFPWSEEVLESPDPWEEDKLVKETHFAFLGLGKIGGEPLSLAKWHELHSGSRVIRIGGSWYLKDKFALQTCGSRWYLMRYTLKQLEILPEEYELPLAVERVVANTLHYRSNGFYLDRGIWARCRDMTDYGEPVGVEGLPDPDETLGLSTWGICGVRGVAASRKIPS